MARRSANRRSMSSQRRVHVPVGDFKRRRERMLSMMAPGSVALLSSAAVQLRNRDTEHPFRQDSDFYYLTGFTEPDAMLVLAPGRAGGECLLFCRERDPAREQWAGERLGPDRAAQSLGVDDAFPIVDADDIVPGLLEGRERIYYALGGHSDFDRKVMQWLGNRQLRGQSSVAVPGELADLGPLLHELRLIKQPAEIRVMKAAADISTAAHRRILQVCEPGMSEARLEAELLYAFHLAGARHPAYECIVGSGENACVMHYVRNDAVMTDGQLVLVDAGCEYEHYASDVTRTFPVNGRFSAEQRALYEVVLAAQSAAIDAMKVGNSFDLPHQRVIETLIDGLVDLGILQGDRQSLIEQNAHLPFTVHKTSHWLGLDVHDVGDYRVGGVWRELQPGMVLTIEPGCYIPASFEHVPARFRGLGIRIEDDVLITDGEPDVLTAAAPKSVADIEQVMRDG